jgi:hypothetical protein
MKISKILSILVMVFLLSSCTSNSVENVAKSTVTISPDSLMGLWNTAWNKTDSLAILNMLTEQTQVVFSNKERMVGADSIMTKWVRTNLPMVRNLKTNKYKATATNELAYYSGDYSLDMVRNDSIIGSDLGCFTFIWKLQDNKSWKMEMLFFGEVVK